ncbi:MAG: hypothetical protein ICV64_11120 [Thermoleophilia bacterium]|nr:hypothetical protein [Thermoleophilia bacterium]
MSRRSVLALVAGIAVAAVAVAAAERATATRDYVDPRRGWTVEVPRGFDVRPFARDLRAFVDGAVFATRPVPAPTNSFPTLRHAPSDGVAFLLYRLQGPVSYPRSGPETDFPLSLADLRPDPYVEPAHEGRWLHGPVEANGWTLTAEAWIGADASAADVVALERLVRSLRFAPLREGTVTGDDFYVLGRAEDYAVGSVTSFPARSLPITEHARLLDFFLVRAPRRFYALAGTCPLPAGYAGCSWCPVRYDAEAREFHCRVGARWDLLGGVLARPRGGRERDDPLSVLTTKVAPDGHVLVSTSHLAPRHELRPSPWRAG